MCSRAIPVAFDKQEYPDGSGMIRLSIVRGFTLAINRIRSGIAAISASCYLAGVAAAMPADQSRPYLSFSHGPSQSVNYFPIAVWLQSPANAARYKSAGFNLYIGLWQGPTEAQLAELKSAAMPVICEQNSTGRKHLEDPTIVGWMHQDEPDNAQPVKAADGSQTYGPCVPPLKIVEEYEQLKKVDPTRPIMLNLGQGVADDTWIGRGNGAKPEDYAKYVQGGDITSFDIYPFASNLHGNGEKNVGFVARGVDRLKQWAGKTRTVWNCIECSQIDGATKPTPAQTRAEVWMSLIHGSRGLIYFVHQFKPVFNEHALLDDPAMLAEVTRTNRQIASLAAVLNQQDVAPCLLVDGKIDMVCKQSGDAIYLFAVNRTGAVCDADVKLPTPAGTAAEAVDESRKLHVSAGSIKDRFEPWQVHIYRIPGLQRR